MELIPFLKDYHHMLNFFVARIMAALGPKIYLVQCTFFESGSMKLNSISFDHSFSMASQITNSYYYDDSGPKKGENYNENLLDTLGWKQL